MTRPPTPLWVTGIVVAVSGFCSLVYQVVWERCLRYNFGGDSISAAVVSATFLLGLGVGAIVFGRRFARPFTVLALVEGAVGLYATASYAVIAGLAPFLAHLFSLSIADAEGLRPTVVLAAVLFLLPPCILMGGTLPLMFSCFIRPAAYTSAAVGALYGLNTLGAALGVLAAPFVFLNRLSLPATLGVVGSSHVLLGLVIAWLGRGFVATDTEVRREPGDSGRTGGLPVPALLALAFVSGFISLAFEVVVVRAAFILNPSSAYNFPAVLVAFLAAIAIGSSLFARLTHETRGAALRRAGLLFLLAAAGIGLSVVARPTVSLSRVGIELSKPDTRALWALHGVLMVAPLPFFLSGVFPLLLRLAARTAARLPAATGTVYFVNSVGSFSGALTVQFAGFPLLGTKGVLIGLILAGAAAGGWCLLAAGSTVRQRLVAAALTAGVAAAPFTIPRASWDVYRSGVAGRRHVERVEGVTGVALIQWEPAGEVYVNGQIMSALPDHPNHVRLVSFALSLPRRAAVLLLGLGGGGMVRELVRDPAIERVEVVDWSYELPVLLDTPRAKGLLHDALKNPKVRVRRSDARVAVSLYEPGTFDVVIDNLGFPHWVGLTSVKSVTYFQQVRRILKPAGVFITANYDTVGARPAIFAGLARTFQVLHVHRQAGIALASDVAIEIDRTRADEVLEWRAKVLGVRAVPPSSWLVDGLRPIAREGLQHVSPVRDELLIHEYHRDPLGTWLRRLQTGGR